MAGQSSEAQKGEIEFRRKLSRQQVTGETLLQDEFDGPGIIKILAERMQRTAAEMSALRDRGIPVAPWLEIGAERCQSALVLENDLGSPGLAADISCDMLRSCDHYMGVFAKKKAPLRICCDANRLPLLSGSLPFVFCHQTLHHFPAPAPVTAEILRVLSPGGHFLLADEPFRKTLHLPLYKGRKVYAPNPGRTGRLRERLDFFFSEKNCNETGYGIIENEAISTGQWRRALAGFEERRVTLKTIKGVESELFSPSSLRRFFICWLFGGRIAGLCRKSGRLPAAFQPPAAALACPACLEAGRESPLAGGAAAFCCGSCGSSYPAEGGVVFLFTAAKFRELYPEEFRRADIREPGPRAVP